MKAGPEDRLEAVRRRMGEACRRAGRDPREVALVAVTKGHGPEELKRLQAAGQRVFAENRVQEWQAKAELVPGAEWHFIGNLQRNKVRFALPFALIHSLNSERLADELQKVGEKRGHVFRTLVEVNVAGEETKQGADLGAAARLVEHARRLPHVEVRGLMTMAPYSDDPETARPHFRKLRELRDMLGLEHLSMGMSGDFEVAIEEGATMVRVGSALFGATPAGAHRESL